MKIRNQYLLLIISFGLLALAVLGSVTIGPVPVSLSQFTGGGTGSQIIFDIRLPRAIAAAFAGAGLAAAGTALQALFRNDLADPYILGTSSGGAVGASLMMALGLMALIPAAAFVGAITAVFLVYLLASRDGRISTSVLLLTGIAVSTFFSAVVSVFMVFAGTNMHQIVFWLMGGLWNTSWNDIPLLSLIFVPVILLILYSRDLNIITCGDSETQTLGIDPHRTKLLLLGAAAGITGIIVSVTGSIGFIGLVSPHLTRLITGPNHAILIPGSLCCGAFLLLIADTISRTWLGELPVGVVTAFFGAPFFLFLIRRREEL
ncbi:MAG: iron chelate uptake ABC transporter family permease subunit [Methanospirillum sp.]|uniref:FecCD family ABC transporter permease n=1 Tax=Methanospirillum sp. TaxID=45200 RepID=UPI00236E66FE|nr:iron chelate uptake ABC transporter family permease subunit [Methanospirillum sp.]MDD1730124.1 iron chelate uptake ABC transporter family permease subunit [Methanospirillum sp.]